MELDSYIDGNAFSKKQLTAHLPVRFENEKKFQIIEQFIMPCNKSELAEFKNITVKTHLG